MKKQQSNHPITTTRHGNSATRVTKTPTANTTLLPAEDKQSSTPWLFCLTIVGFLVVLGVIVLVIWNISKTVDQSPSIQDPWPVESEVSARFLIWHNAGDPAAGDLLGRVPSVPVEPITEEQADALQTDYFLRDPGLRIISVRRKEKGSIPSFVFRTSGNVSAPRLPVQTKDGPTTTQRTMSNPDLHVTIQNGKILGKRSTLQRN